MNWPAAGCQQCCRVAVPLCFAFHSCLSERWNLLQLVLGSETCQPETCLGRSASSVLHHNTRVLRDSVALCAPTLLQSQAGQYGCGSAKELMEGLLLDLWGLCGSVVSATLPVCAAACWC